jgi:hypothetical protein
MILPFGTILLGIASFGIWVWKRDRVEDRNLKYASALRAEPTAESWRRHFTVLEEVSKTGTANRLASTASYVESSLGAESMGYSPQRFVVKLEEGQSVAGVLAELTGKQRPREVVLVVLSFGAEAPMNRGVENAALASMLSLAHWLTGEPTQRTLRFVMLPLESVDAAGKLEALTRLGEEMRRRNERVTHLLNATPEAGNLTALTETALDMAARGTVSGDLMLPLDGRTGLPEMAALRKRLLGLAERP